MPTDFAVCYYHEQMFKYEQDSIKAQKAMYIFMKLLEGETIIDADRME
jgi:hypothetical protein